MDNRLKLIIITAITLVIVYYTKQLYQRFKYQKSSYIYNLILKEFKSNSVDGYVYMDESQIIDYYSKQMNLNKDEFIENVLPEIYERVKDSNITVYQDESNFNCESNECNNDNEVLTKKNSRIWVWNDNNEKVNKL